MTRRHGTVRDPLRGARVTRRAVVAVLALIALIALIALLVPLTAASAGGSATVHVHFTPQGSECDVTTAYPRQVPTPRVLSGALEQLLAGPTADEAQVAASMFGVARPRCSRTRRGAGAPPDGAPDTPTPGAPFALLTVTQQGDDAAMRREASVDAAR